MSIRTSPWPPGVPCWTDLTVPDVPAAVAFYGMGGMMGAPERTASHWLVDTAATPRPDRAG